MNLINNGTVTFPMYHGTSSLFLDGICQNGLGGRNPIKDWKILELAREVLSLSEVHLKDFPTFDIREQAFRLMVEQKISAGGMNFQHGDTYLSPSKMTAIKYATSKRYGSELITYTMDLLQELANRDVPGVRTSLFKKYPDGFRLLDISPAPILIEVINIPAQNLLDEFGKDATENLREIQANLKNNSEIADVLNQQVNFRLTSPVQFNSLKFWLINVIQHKGWGPPDYNLYNLTKTSELK